MFVTFFDTQMATLTALIVWRIRPWMVVLPWLAISAMDGAFLSSALTKVPNGAWFTLTLASVLAAVFILWRFGKEQQWRAERQDRNPLVHYLKKDEDGNLCLNSSAGKPTGEALSVTKGFGIFFDKAGDQTPMIFSQFINKLVSKPEVTVFFHLRPLESPTVDLADRYVVRKIDYLPDCYRVVARYGYMDEVVTPDLASLIYTRIRDHIVLEHGHKMRKSCASSVDIADDVLKTDVGVTEVGDVDEKVPAYTSRDSKGTVEADDDSIPLGLSRLQQAFEHRVLYIIGKEEMHLAPKTKFWRLILLKIFLFLRENTRNKMANVKVPTDRLVEIGFVMDV